MVNRKIQATAVLLLMVAGFILTYGSKEQWVKIINAGFLAGIIGGLADWFAITALFRKPLGFISVGTEILPKNRQRIIDEIVKFIGEDLLNTKYLQEQMRKISLNTTLAKYLQSPKVTLELAGITKNLATLLAEPIGELLPKLLKAASLSSVTVEEAKGWSRSLYLELIKKEKDPVIIHGLIFLIKLVQNLLTRDFIHQFLDYHVEALKEKYVGNNFARSMAVGFMDLSGADLAKKFNGYLDELVLNLQKEDSRAARYYQLRIARKLRSYLANPLVWDKLLAYGREKISQVELSQQPKLNSFIEQELQHFMDINLQNEDRLQQISDWLKQQVANYLDNNGEMPLNYLREQLNRYSNEELIELVENKVGDDLQMIRINGSLVGAVAGMVLYALSYGVERMWG